MVTVTNLQIESQGTGTPLASAPDGEMRRDILTSDNAVWSSKTEGPNDYKGSALKRLKVTGVETKRNGTQIPRTWVMSMTEWDRPYVELKQVKQSLRPKPIAARWKQVQQIILKDPIIKRNSALRKAYQRLFKSVKYSRLTRVLEKVDKEAAKVGKNSTPQAVRRLRLAVRDALKKVREVSWFIEEVRKSFLETYSQADNQYSFMQGTLTKIEDDLDWFALVIGD